MNGENRPIGPAPLPENMPPGAMPAGRQEPPTPPAPPPVPPTGASGPPPPPPPQIDIRTLASDADSLKTSGGMGTTPKTFSPADLAKEPIFGAEIVSPAPGPAHTGGAGKKLALALGAVAVLAAAAAVGYFWVWPLFSGDEEQVTETTPPPALPTPTPSPTPAHQSYFKTAPGGGARSASVSSLTLAGLGAAIKATSSEATSTALLKEITLSVGGKAVTSADLTAAILPGSGLEAYLESDTTVYAYYMSGKSYPGYIFKLKDGADLTAAKAAAAKVEQSTNLAALYPESPGAPKGSWKDGSISGVGTRYQAYSSAGASLNYGWVSAESDYYLVVSTSFDGFKKALDLLK